MTEVKARQAGVYGISGARACLDACVADIRGVMDSRPNPVAPIWVITPSSALRRQVCEALVETGVGATLGVSIHTLRSAAHTILADRGRILEDRSATFPWELREKASDEPTLARDLAELDDGFSTAAESMRDILDAGFHEGMLEPALEAIAPYLENSGGQRAAALLRAASRLPPTPGTLRYDGDRLVTAAREVPFSPLLHQVYGVFILGFMDATGPGMDLLEALQTYTPARLYLDFPEDPAQQGVPDAGASYGVGFTARMGFAGHLETSSKEAPHLEAFDASGIELELLEIARRVRHLLDDGSLPESIGIVVRSLEGVRVPMARALTALGIPFSIPAAHPKQSPKFRSFRGLIRVLIDGSNTPIDPWLETLPFPSISADDLEGKADLRTGLKALGVSRIGEWREDKDSTTPLSLPVRRGLESRESIGVVLPRRKVDKALYQDGARRSQSVLEHLRSWPTKGPLGAYNPLLHDLVTNTLQWPAGPSLAILTSAMQSLDVDEGPLVTPAEYALSLDRALAAALLDTKSEQRKGVRVLDAPKARGLVFEHLFLAQMNRGVFPRTVREDPLFSDTIRGALLPILPDLHAKGLGHQEERYLFAQLLGSAPHVTLSWLRADSDGMEMARSVLIERLLLSKETVEIHRVPRELSQVLAPLQSPVSTRVRTSREHAIFASLKHQCESIHDTLALALANQTSQGRPVALGRQEILEEITPDRRTQEGRRRFLSASPCEGSVGEASHPRDPRAHALAVTTLEAYGRCPWQAWLTKMLRIEKAPDVSLAPPELPRNLIGTTVHRALELVLIRKEPSLEGRDLDGTQTPFSISKPLASEIQSALREAVIECGRHAGILQESVQEVLFTWCLPYVTNAIELDWPTPTSTVPVLGVEVSSSFSALDNQGTAYGTTFKADRVDQGDNGPLYTDYKTGKALSNAKTEKTRREHLLKAIRTGRTLQGPGYAHSGPGASGRYLFIKPSDREMHRSFCLEHGDPEFAPTFEETTSLLLSGLAKGACPPRIQAPDGKGNDMCDTYCTVTEACSIHDSGRKHRIRQHAEAVAPKGKIGSDARPDELAARILLSAPPEETP